MEKDDNIDLSIDHLTQSCCSAKHTFYSSKPFNVGFLRILRSFLGFLSFSAACSSDGSRASQSDFVCSSVYSSIAYAYGAFSNHAMLFVCGFVGESWLTSYTHVASYPYVVSLTPGLEMSVLLVFRLHNFSSRLLLFD